MSLKCSNIYAGTVVIIYGVIEAVGTVL
jgi:hypothetical protein